MIPTQVVDITISNISKEQFNYILIDITTAISSTHFNTDCLHEQIYKYIYFKKVDVSSDAVV